VTQTLASEGNYGAPTPDQIDFTVLYQEIADYVIIKAHSGDPLFEKIFALAWNKTRLSRTKNLLDSKEPENTFKQSGWAATTTIEAQPPMDITNAPKFRRQRNEGVSV
jgi:hypothetical protein